MACVFLFSTDGAVHGPWPMDDGEAWLAPDESLRADRFADRQNRKRYVRSVFALRSLLSQAGVPQIMRQPFKRGLNGKPNCQGAVHFSLARSHDVVMIGLSGHGPIGVDIEKITHTNACRRRQVAADWPDRYPALAAQLAPADLPLRGTELDKHGTFLRAWTRLEALVKRDGLSLARVLDGAVDISAPNSPGRLIDIEAPTGFVAACALSRQEDVRVVMGRNHATPT